MSKATAFIYFPESKHFYFGGYNGTSDCMKADILPLTKENIQKYPCSNRSVNGIKFYYENNKEYTNDIIEDAEKNDTECWIFTEYGGGFYWEARGCEKYNLITKGFSDRYIPEKYIDDDPYFYNSIDGEPDWLDEVRHIISNYMEELRKEDAFTDYLQ